MQSSTTIAIGEATSAGTAPDGDGSGPRPDGQAPQRRLMIEVQRDPAVRQAIDLAWLRDHLRAAAELIARSSRHINVRILDDAAMRALHHRHSGCDETTDVLTFPLAEPGEAIEVDIAVCADEAARRSAELGHSIERELLLYCVHGLLHCAGFDDHDEAAYRAMHAEEDRILAAIGVGATFAANGEAGEP